MRPEDLLIWRRAAPFQPFRIVLNSGRTYIVRHPEMLRVGRTTVNFFWFGPGEMADPYERMEMFSLLLIEHIEHVGTPATA